MVGKTEQNTKEYEQHVARLRAMLRSWNNSGVDLFLELQKFERSEIWRYGRHDTFMEFLRRTFPDAIGYERYNNVMRAIEEFGVDQVRLVGVDGCHALLLSQQVLKSPEKKQEVLAAIGVHVAEDGCPPAAAKIRAIVYDIGKDGPPCKEVNTARRQTAERQEIRRLESRIVVLENENKELKAELKRVNVLLRRTISSSPTTKKAKKAA